MNFQSTLGNRDWLTRNEEAIKKLFPDTWTHMENVNALSLGFRLKLLGIDWRSEDEFGKVMLFFEKIGFLLRQNGHQVMANPRKML